MFGYYKTVRLCLLEYLIILVFHVFYGLYSFLLSIMAFICCIVIPLVMIYLIFNNTENFSFIVLTYIFIFTGISYFVNYKVGYKNFKKFEYKSFYYLPIRFNRKNKKVYVFTKDGEEKIYDWDELFFYIATVDWLYGIKKVED